MRPQLFALLCLLFALPQTLNARIINVPDDFDTIQEAINSASVDAIDTVLLAADTYTGDGNINLSIDHNLVLMSLAGATEAIIDCEDAADSRGIFATTSFTLSGIGIWRAAANGVRIDNAGGFLIESCQFMENEGVVGQQSGGGLQVRTSTGIVSNCIFEANTNIGSGGGVVITSSEVSFESCIFLGNHAERFGGGVLVTNNSVGSFFNCLFVTNTSGIDGGGLAHSIASSSDLSFCTFVNNEAVGMGGGLYKGSNSNPVIINSIFWGNTADIGNQLAAQDNGGEITISYCIAEGGADEAGRWDGENIIDEDPLLTDGREPVWGWNGFYLDQDQSPAVDAGSGAADELGVNFLFTDPDLGSDADQADIGFHYWIGWFNIFGRVYGTVLSLGDDNPISGAVVRTTLGQSTITDDEGLFEFPEARVGDFSISATREYFNSVNIADQHLDEDEELEVTLRMPHPEFDLSTDNLATEIGVDDSTDLAFEVINNGNGELNWSVSAHLLPEFDQDPWEPLQTFQTGNDVEDNRIMGVAFDGEHYYVSGADGNEPNKIYVLDAEGNYTGEFVQPGSTQYGMRDLAWDGELLWGASNRDYIGFTTEGDSVIAFEGPLNPGFNITYDSDRGLYWISGLTTDIYAYDRDWNQVDHLSRGGARIYGLAYFSGDRDGAQIYIHGNSADDLSPQIFKLNIETEELTQVAILQGLDNASTEGIEISNQIDQYAVTLIAVYNDADGDFINLWRMNKQDQWFVFEPADGVVQGGETQEVTLLLNSQDLLDGFYQAEAQFDYNAVGDQTILPIEMEITAGPVHTSQRIPMRMGWNLIGSNLQPDVADVETIMEPLVETGELMFMKDISGHMYNPDPDNHFINIPDWQVEQPYWIKLRQPGVLNLEGMSVASNEPIALRQGWNGVSYFPRLVMDAWRAFGGLGDALEIARDGEGNFLIPRYNFSNIPACRRGNGYMVRIANEVDFIWGEDPQNDFASPQTWVALEPQHFAIPTSTGFSMAALFLTSGQDGDEIAVMSGETIVGAGVIHDGKCGFAIRGDDPTTLQIEGAKPGDELALLRYSQQSHQIEKCNYSLLEGKLIYSTDGVIVAKLEEVSLPLSTTLIDAYPNPFNSATTISVSLSEESDVTLWLYDISGRQVQSLVEGELLTGIHRYSFDASDLSTGIYFLKLQTPTVQLSRRLLLIR